MSHPVVGHTNFFVVVPAGLISAPESTMKHGRYGCLHEFPALKSFPSCIESCISFAICWFSPIDLFFKKHLLRQNSAKNARSE